MKVLKSGSRVLWLESVGFGLILLLACLNRLVDLPLLLIGVNSQSTKWRDTAVESVLILLIWAFVFSVTRRLVDHLHYLEGMLRLCAWCRKVGHGEKWMKFEDYFAEGFDIGTTHGICPDCRKQMEEDTRQFYRREGNHQAVPLSNPDSA